MEEAEQLHLPPVSTADGQDTPQIYVLGTTTALMSPPLPVRRVVTATGGISQFQMVCTIDPCAAHSTLSAQPHTQAAPSALSSAMASLAGATPSQPPAATQPPSLGPNPTPPTNPPAVQNPGPSASAPPGRNTTRSYSLATIDRKYNQIVSLVNGGTSLEEAYTDERQADNLSTIQDRGRG